MSGDPGANDLAIAVIGMACRFPGADTLEAFWENLKGGVCSVTFFSDEELAQAGVPTEVLENPAYVKAGAVLRDVEGFDAGFFGYSAREAQVLDPQQRLFLEMSWEALERAGYDPDRYRGSIGVFGGVSSSAWSFALMSDARLRGVVSPYQMMLSTDKDFLASRVAYKLDLRGPAVVIQTACSTSLVAVHMACQSLLAGECDMALAGGVSVGLRQRIGYLHEPDGILSADGHCRAFDASATGTVKGSGAGLVVLKRLADALRDRDQIEAVVRGSATNNDGAGKVGFTAPGVDGQAGAVRAAQAISGVGPEEITYVEAHGTATTLGDPIELAALTQAFGTKRRGHCAIGSVKSNIGHLDAAAGVAGLIKTVLMLKHRELVPSLHFERPNPRLHLEASPFVVATRHAPWSSDGPLRAGVSSFGIGGTNAHVILEEPPVPSRVEATPRLEILLVSARSRPALERATDELVRHIQAHADLSLADVAFTLSAGRRAFGHRRAVLCRDLSEGARLLAARDRPGAWSGVAETGRPVAFLFPGQGAQAVNMGRGLYESEPAVRTAVDRCAERLREVLGVDLRQLMYPAEHEAEATAQRLQETCFTQPALFAIEYALAQLWRSWGVVPAAMIGHSVGEYVAACLAGVMDLDEALAVVAERARLMQACPKGAMTAVSLSTEALRPFLDGRLDLCVVNGLEACVAGGPIEDILGLEGRLLARGVAFSRVPTSHAFHSAMMEPALLPFAERMARVKLRPPTVPFVSNLTGTWITSEQATDPAYWVRQLRETVRFSEGLETLLEKPGLVALEVGPGQVLTALARRRLPRGSGGLALPSLPHPRHDQPDEGVLLETAARLWCAGVSVDWSPRDRRARARRVTLPTYPFERERYWIDPPSAPNDLRPPVNGHPAPNPKLPVDRWFHAPTWKRAETRPLPPGDLGSFCVLADGTGIGEALGALLKSAGAPVTIVRPGAEFSWTGPHEAALAPGRRTDYDRLLDALDAGGGVPARFVHLWGVGAGAEGSVERGLLSVLHLGQALGRRQSRETDLLVVTSGAQDVLGDETLFPLAAAMLGPCRVIPQEYPLVRCRSLDLAVTSPSSVRPWLAEAVLTEAVSTALDAIVAYRGRARFVPVYEPLTMGAEALASSPVGAPVRLRPRGVYLLTGGLGKVASSLARHLAREVQARLVLTGRNVPGAEGTPAIRELEALGAEVLVVKADAADLVEMQNAFALARARFGGLDGVIHAAGDLGAGVMRPLASTGREDCERQMRPKLGGAQVLATLLADAPIDFVMLASSLSTVLGGLGLGAYSAANHALDAFARIQHQAGHRAWLSVAWDGWGFDPAAGASPLTQTAISPAEGEEAFRHLLAFAQRPQIVVSTTPLEARLAAWTKPAEAPSPETGTPSLAPDLHPRPELGVVYVPPEDPIERGVAAIWAELLGIDRVGIDDNFFELGGSSLLALHLMGRIKKEFPVDLSVVSLFEAPTVRALSGVIRTRRGQEPGLVRSADRGQMRKESRKNLRRKFNAAVE